MKSEETMKFKEENLIKARERDARIIAQDMLNSYSCAYDRKSRDAAKKLLRKAHGELKKNIMSKPHVSLWVDGSYNPKSNSAGVGIIISRNDGSPDIVFGKPVKAKDSLSAEIYALSIGLSYILDTFTDIDNIIIRYDCVSSTVCAANINAFSDFGAPYTNFRSALKRIRKKKISVLFEHTDAHAADKRNNSCDLVARYYSRIKLQGAQLAQVKKLIKAKEEEISCRQEPRPAKRQGH